ncbi:MAG: hypothetical protein ACE5J2_04575 [Nitrososphaerales archaeon]
MNSSLMLKAIPVIKEGNISFDEFALITGVGKKTSMELIGFLTKSEIGIVDSQSVNFNALDKMRAAMLAIRMGVDIEDLSKILNWRDFEMLATNILDACGYVAYHGLRLKKPRTEIDVVGIKDVMALLLDCKHWKKSNPSALSKFALMQIDRAESFIEANKWNVRFAVPAILTLHLDSIIFANDVPVIPITKFRSFLNELAGHLNEIKVVPR